MVWWKKALVVLGICLIPTAGLIGYQAAAGGCTCGVGCKCPPPCPCSHHAAR